MKKSFVVIILCVLFLFTLCACSQGFMSSASVKKLAKNYANSQAEVTFEYKKNNTNYKVVFVYDLLLDKTPATCVAFINLVNDGFYNKTIVDYFNSTYNYFVLGRYNYDVESSKYYQNKSNLQLVGEFKSNNYAQPKDGFATFAPFSLAFYHDNNAESFNKGNGALVLALSEQTINANNYAVFAKVNSVSVSVDGGQAQQYNKIPSYLFDHFVSFGSSSSRTVYDSLDSTTSTSAYILSARVNVSAKMLGNYDWTKLPKVGK